MFFKIDLEANLWFYSIPVVYYVKYRVVDQFHQEPSDLRVDLLAVVLALRQETEVEDERY